MPVILTDLLLITAAAFLAGLLNAVAGGGSLLTLPSLIWIGIPPVAANATGTAALLPGYVASAWTDRKLIGEAGRRSIWLLIILGTLGGVAGAILLLLTTDQAFRVLIPWLLLFATLLFALGPRLQRFINTGNRHLTKSSRWYPVGVLGASMYGGYFNGGLGIVILALFRFFGEEDIHIANALKNLLSAVLTVIAVAIYAVGGIIYYAQWLPMAVAAGVGGWLGIRIARHIPAQWLRLFIVAVGLLMSLLFFME